MKISNKDNLVEVTLDATLSKNNIKDMYKVIDKVANDEFDVCICSHSNGNTLQFIGVDDMFSIEYVNTQDDSIYKIQDKSKVNDDEEIDIISNWGIGTFNANCIVTCEQVKTLFDTFFKTDNCDEFKDKIDKLGFTTMQFNPEF